MIRVLVVEDSATTRALLEYLLEEDGGFDIVGAAGNGAEAVAMSLQHRPDVILMDVYMPVLNGLEATRQIMETVPTPIVMVSAAFDERETELTFAALEAGALTIVAKPVGPGHPAFLRSAAQLCRILKAMAEVRVVRRWPKRPPGQPMPVAAATSRRVSVLAIGVSTGGPGVLMEILEALPGTLGMPIHLVQHMAVGFVDGLVRWLAGKTKLAVKTAVDGEWSRAGTVYVAPDGFHLGVAADGRVVLSEGAPENGFCPSASFLFRSVAAAYGASAMGVLLTGMGTDGADGLLALRRAGGLTAVQDEASSVVFGMAGEAIRLGAAEKVLPPDKIAALIRSVA